MSKTYIVRLEVGEETQKTNPYKKDSETKDDTTWIIIIQILLNNNKTSDIKKVLCKKPVRYTNI